MVRFGLGCVAIGLPLLLAGHALAEEPSASDIAAVQACTDLAAKNAKDRPLHGADELAEKPGPQGRLAAAAKAAAYSLPSCIGVLAAACIQQHGETASDNVFGECRLREAQVWDKRLNIAYRAASKKMEKPAADNLMKTQRAWIAWRDASCQQPWITFQGTMAGPMQAWCTLRLTAEQALWMEDWAENAAP
jgi:uncharacterized protein YecT (DUF1311 family)